MSNPTIEKLIELKIDNADRNKKNKKYRKALKEFKTKKTEDLKWKLRLLTLKNKHFKELSDYEEEGEKREITRKNVKDWWIWKIGGKKALELRIGTIECVSCKLICNLNMEKWLEMKKIKNLKQDRRN